MSQDPLVPLSPKPSLGDRIRDIAHQLRQENTVQIKATSRILGAAAQLAENHDQLIDEVVEMVETDLAQAEPDATSHQVSPPPQLPAFYTVAQLQQQFKKLSDAKAHFGLKASSWAALAAKLNRPSSGAQPPGSFPGDTQALILQRLDAIEQDMQILHRDLEQVRHLLAQFAASQST